MHYLSYADRLKALGLERLELGRLHLLCVDLPVCDWKQELFACIVCLSSVLLNDVHNQLMSHLHKSRTSQSVDADDISLTTTILSE